MRLTGVGRGEHDSSKFASLFNTIWLHLGGSWFAAAMASVPTWWQIFIGVSICARHSSAYAFQLWYFHELHKDHINFFKARYGRAIQTLAVIICLLSIWPVMKPSSTLSCDSNTRASHFILFWWNGPTMCVVCLRTTARHYAKYAVKTSIQAVLFVLQASTLP